MVYSHVYTRTLDEKSIYCVLIDNAISKCKYTQGCIKMLYS